MLRVAMLPWLLVSLMACTESAPAIQIDGPELVPTGRLAVYQLPQEALKSPPEWLVVGPADECFHTCDAGRTLCFASPVEGHYIIIAGVIVDDAVKLLRKDIYVGDEEPNPNPNPPEPEPPEPPEPATWADWAASKAKELVPPEGLADATKVASALRSVVAAVDEKKIVTPRFAREQVRAVVRGNLRTIQAIQRWEQFSLALDTALDEEAAAGKLATLADYRKVWSEVADGLEKVNK